MWICSIKTIWFCSDCSMLPFKSVSSLTASSPLLTSLNRSEIQHSWILQTEQIPHLIPAQNLPMKLTECSYEILKLHLLFSQFSVGKKKTKKQLYRKLFVSCYFLNLQWLLISSIIKNLNRSQTCDSYFKIKTVLPSWKSAVLLLKVYD